MTTPQATQTATAAPNPQPKTPRSASTTLKGDGGVLRILVVFKKHGATTFVIHSTKRPDGKNDNQRGATQQHATAAEAHKAAERLVEQALKLGWQRSERRAGFTAAPDAFTAAALPAPKPKTTSKKR